MKKSQSQSQTLRDLIKKVRNCKTTAEERALVKKEQSIIRESIAKNEDSVRVRNVSKLLFISMLGHNTEVGQMECLKLITANSFNEKRIGYLGLAQLFHENSEVLIMATHRIKYDLNQKNSSNYVISLALMSITEICTPQMVKETITDVLQILESGTSFIRKKAALASVKIIKMLPDQTDVFAQKIEPILDDKHHGVLLSALTLVIEIIQISDKYKKQFRKHLGQLVRILAGLNSKISNEFDINGVIDPFLQVYILKFFQLICENDQEASNEVNDIISQILDCVSLQKMTGFVVQYEAIKTVFAIKSSNNLKTQANNQLGKFLQAKDPNVKFIGLSQLATVIPYDINAVRKHTFTILECAKEQDKSIQQTSLDLIQLICSQQTAKLITRTLFNILIEETDEIRLKEITQKCQQIIDKCFPNREWYIDTYINLLSMVGNYINDTSTLINLIYNTPEIQESAVKKLYHALPQNKQQDGLILVSLFCFGESGEKLIGEVTQGQLIEQIQNVLNSQFVNDQIIEYALNCLIKLYFKFRDHQNTIANIIKKYTVHTGLETQKRACEYNRLIELDWPDKQNLIKCIPDFEPCAQQFAGIKVFDDNKEEAIDSEQIIPTQTEQTTNKKTNNDDLLDIFGDDTKPKEQETKQQPQQPVKKIEDDLIDIFGSQPASAQQPVQQRTQQPAQTGFDDLLGDLSAPVQPAQPTAQVQHPIASDPLDFLGSSQPPAQQPSGFDFMGSQQPSQPAPQQTQQQNTGFNDLLFDTPVTSQTQQKTHQFQALSDQILNVDFNCSLQGNKTQIKATFTSKVLDQITDIVFQVAALKHLTLELKPLNQNYIPPNGTTHQDMDVTNNMQKQRPIALRVKLNYKRNGFQQTLETTITNFPQDW